MELLLRHNLYDGDAKYSIMVLIINFRFQEKLFLVLEGAFASFACKTLVFILNRYGLI